MVVRVWQILSLKISTVNIFQPSIDITDERELAYEVRNGFIATRVFFVPLISILLILSFVLRLTTETNTITLKNPTRSDYEKLLLAQESTSLNCPCTNIATLYNQAIRLAPSFHPICTSNYSERWKFLDDDPLDSDTSITRNRNFKNVFISQMRMLTQLCSLAQTTVASGLFNFYTNSFVSTQLLAISLLTSQVQSVTDIFTTDLAANFILTLDIVTKVIQNNQLVSADYTNWQLFLSSLEILNIESRPVSYENCSCDSSDLSLCTSAMLLVIDYRFWIDGNFYKNLTIKSIPGLACGCYNFESLKKSSMALFFNQTAIDNVIVDYFRGTYVSRENDTYVNVLNASQLGVNHQINASIGDLLAQLFVEDWHLQMSYDEYFSACAPLFCSYQLVERHKYLYISTFLLGLISGLTTGLRLITLSLVKFLRRKHKPVSATAGKRRLEIS